MELWLIIVIAIAIIFLKKSPDDYVSKAATWGFLVVIFSYMIFSVNELIELRSEKFPNTVIDGAFNKIEKRIVLTEFEISAFEEALKNEKLKINDNEWQKEAFTFLINLATLLGLYRILLENRKEYKEKVDGEKRKIRSLKAGIQLVEQRNRILEKENEVLRNRACS